MRVIGALDPTDADRLRALRDSATRADGVSPLNEEARLLSTRANPSVTHALVDAGRELVGYALADRRHGTGQLFVHPAHRRQGIGSQLLTALPRLGIWAFGDSDAAQGFATHHRLAPSRGLLIMTADVASRAAQPRPAGVRSFDPETDADAFIALNAAAFAGHPEQGDFTRADLDARMAEDWFDPAGLLLTEDADGLTAFHWTKRHGADTGEVYVIGTHPRAQGQGLGKTLLAAGVAHLARLGIRRVILYVDIANQVAVEMYARAGFAVMQRDTLYTPSRGAHS